MDLLNIILFLPLFAILLLNFFKYKFVAGITFLLQLILLFVVGFQEDFSATTQVLWFKVGNYAAFYSIGIDKVSFLLLLLTFVIFLASFFTPLDYGKDNKLYYILLLLLDFSITGSFVAEDFFLFYLFFEFMLIPMYFLIAKWGGRKRVYATFKFFIYTFLGSLILLVGLFALWNSYSAGGNNVLLFSSLSSREYLIEGSYLSTTTGRLLAFLFLFVGFGIKLPLVPLHSWLPTAHVEASTPLSMLLAGVLLKVGGYGLYRFGYIIFPDVVSEIKLYLDIIAVISIVWGGILAFAQADFKRLVAYSSIAHMGYVVLGLNSGKAIGINGALLQLFFHGFLSAGLFFLSGIIYRRAKTRIITDFRGIWKSNSSLGILAGLLFFASAGFPPSGLFISELYVLTGSYASGSSLPIIILALIGILLTTVYLFNAFRIMMFGYPNVNANKLQKIKYYEVSLLIFLLLISFFGGLFPFWFSVH